MANLRARYDAYPGRTPGPRRLGGDGPGHAATHLPLASSSSRTHSIARSPARFLVARHAGCSPHRHARPRRRLGRRAGRPAGGTWRRGSSSRASSSPRPTAPVSSPRPATRDRSSSRRSGELRAHLPHVPPSRRGVRGYAAREPLPRRPWAFRGLALEDRLRGLTALRFRRQGDLVDFGWRYDGPSRSGLGDRLRRRRARGREGCDEQRCRSSTARRSRRPSPRSAATSSTRTGPASARCETTASRSCSTRPKEEFDLRVGGPEAELGPDRERLDRVLDQPAEAPPRPRPRPGRRVGSPGHRHGAKDRRTSRRSAGSTT